MLTRRCKKKRLHSAPRYLTPAEYEMRIEQTKTTDRAPSNVAENSPVGGAQSKTGREDGDGEMAQ